MTLDYLGNHIEVGDTVIFPASGGFMEGVIEKIRPNTRYVFRDNSNSFEVFVKNDMGYKKWKENDSLILKKKGD